MYNNSKSTIKDVAQKAGVSTQTVSRVINDRPDVSKETREKVLAVIQELGYRPSALARGLIQGRSFTLGVVTAGLKHIGPSRTINGITAEAETHGYGLLLEELSTYTLTEVAPILDSLLSHQVDGILWAVPEIGDNRAWLDTHLKDLPVPIVFLSMQPRPNISSLAIDNYLGAKLAVSHLLKRGRRKIAHISGALDWWEAKERKRGWQDALLQADLEPLYYIEGNWSSSSGEIAARGLLDTHPEIDAIFAANDQMALSSLLVAHQKNLHIPEDLAVVGFDDMAESAYFYPPLTTVHQDHFSLGANGVLDLVAQIAAAREEKLLHIENRWLTPELIVRSTT